jgi:signal-transduction protein with cAMP-binding, CBS, and nucleotidyltransferase domain
MAHVKQGQLTKSPQWWKHLKDWKRVFWKSERKAQKDQIRKEQNK